MKDTDKDADPFITACESANKKQACQMVQMAPCEKEEEKPINQYSFDDVVRGFMALTANLHHTLNRV